MINSSISEKNPWFLLLFIDKKLINWRDVRGRQPRKGGSPTSNVATLHEICMSKQKNLDHFRVGGTKESGPLGGGDVRRARPLDSPMQIH